MRVQDLMSEPALTCNVNDDLCAAAKLMWDHDCGALPVVREDGKLAGMITDRDICMAAYIQGRRLDEILVNSVMTGHTVVARPDQKISEVEQVMADRQVHRLPVVDASNRPIGVITLNDLAVESAQPDTPLPNRLAKIGLTLAAISQPRQRKPRATRLARPPQPKSA